MNRPLFILVLTNLTACQFLGIGVPLVVTTERTTYRPGDRIQLAIKNTSNHMVGYNFCLAILERRKGLGWKRVPNENVACLLIQNVVKPQSHVTDFFTLAPGIKQGTYRIGRFVDVGKPGGVRKYVATNSFQVTAR